MINSKIEEYLNARMGLDAASIGRVAVERALRIRLAVCGLDADAYWEHVRGSELETQELIEALVVPETWFFRDRNAFDALTRDVLPSLRKTQPDRVLHILSLPCATGEEPFSIAMALLDAGFAADGFQIDACDISLRAIAFAEQATYGRNSFRGSELGFRARNFEETVSGYRLHDDIRRKVRFAQANVLLDSSFAIGRQYDVIFCRNMLIYFDRRNQQRAVQALARLLAPQGTLFIGASESAPLLSNGFASARLPGACAFRKAGETAVSKRAPSAAQSVVAPQTRTVVSLPLRPTRPAGGVGAAGAPAVALATDQDWITAAQQLADRGDLAEAMQLCDRNLNAAGPCAQAFYLKALLHDAFGQSTEAITHYRKALYLDPSHQDALVHLGAALLQDGDTANAQNLFDRAERLTRSGGD
ncbi:MAG TPA: CheR family methyltransferase [Steroidobacteraceae bacterium]|nr:CheR family methyltransferase [Steroidobacteraceae bacterium]